jgi:hypothetical protein
MYVLNGQQVSRDEFLARAPTDSFLQRPPMTANTYTEHNPLISDGCGVMKSQVAETREAIRAHGIQGAAVLDNGQIRFTSRRARKEFLRMRGLLDNDGGYSDG